MRYRIWFVAVLACGMFCTSLPHAFAALTADDFSTLSSPPTPRVAYAMERDARHLRITIDVASFVKNGSDVTVEVGLAAARAMTVSAKGVPGPQPGIVRCLLDIPVNRLVDTDADWARLRMGIAVRWAGGPFGLDRLQERFLHLDTLSSHAGLSPRPHDWAPCEYFAQATERKNHIRIPIIQPMDGKATIVIEDTNGKRIRNLISGVTLTKGPHVIEWDGLDEDGNVAPPGTYRWRSIHHPGIVPEYVMTYCNADEPGFRQLLSNHGHFVRAAANDTYVFLAAPITEGGYAMVAVDKNGRWAHGYNHISGAGLGDNAIAADQQYLYVANDGISWGMQIDQSKPNWTAPMKLTLTRYDIETGASVNYPGGRSITLESYDYGAGAANAAVRDRYSITGMALYNGKLYLGSRNAQAVLIVDPATGAVQGKIPVADPGSLGASAGKLYAASGSAVVRIDPATATTTAFLPANTLSPRGLAVDAQGNVYISDGITNTVQVVNAAGTVVRTIGQPGGAYVGKFLTERMVNPSGLALLDGRLWVTEDRTNPKRAVAWDLVSGKIVRQIYGNPPYGGSGGGFDTQDPRRWIGLDAAWSLDMAQKTEECSSILGFNTGSMNYRFIHQDGKTFVIAMGKITYLCAWQPDGTLRPLACISSPHQFCYGCNWQPPTAFADALNRAYPKLNYVSGVRGTPNHGMGVLWVDRNGDAQMQSDEFEFAPDNVTFAGGGWGHNMYDITLRVPATIDGKPAILTLAPKGYSPAGVPLYPKLSDALAQAVPVKSLPNTPVSFNTDSMVDRFGDLILKSDPNMTCFAPDGTLRWTFPNRWSDVHGSHDAPMPETGVMQGTLFFLGTAPLDDKADVFMINGNHGRFFILTSDGLYLDEMFRDVRTQGTRDEFLVGGECFGGMFGKAETDGQYYLLTGGDGFRVFRLHGLAEVKRGGGTLTVTPTQVLVAERNLHRQLSASAQANEATIAYLNQTPQITGKGTGWPQNVTLAWDKGPQYPVNVKCAYDTNNLYLSYEVRDDSPWVNNGADWTMLFKTGDAVHLDFGTDPTQAANRKGAVPGDIRVLIAPFQGKEIVVLYRYRAPGATNPVPFASPWRTEKVDVVKRLDNTAVAVQKTQNLYRVEAAIPLKELGLSPVPGKSYKADFGAIYGDKDGTIDLMRSCWSNKATGLVNDVPGEIMLSPQLWGTVRFAEKEAAQ